MVELRVRIKELEGKLSFEYEIVRVDKDAEVAALEARVAERENGMLLWKQRESKALTRIKELEEELTELRAERDAWRRSLVEEQVIGIDEDGHVTGPEHLRRVLAGEGDDRATVVGDEDTSDDAQKPGNVRGSA